MPDGATRADLGRFFPLDVSTVLRIAKSGLGFEEVLAYVIAAAHTQGRGCTPHRLSTSGRKAIYIYGGVPLRRANRAIETLCETGFLSSAEEARQRLGTDVVPSTFGSSQVRPRYYVHGKQDEFDLATNVPHSLIRGAGPDEQPPLKRLMSTAMGDPNYAITLSEARLDALLVLLNMYSAHSMEAFGGVDPRRGPYRRWTVAPDTTDPIEEDLYPRTVEEFPDSNLALFEIEGREALDGLLVAQNWLPHIPPESIEPRLCLALANLQRAGFLYETVAIWSADPSADSAAEPLYTLYVRDPRARQNGEPYLQRKVHRVAAEYLLGGLTIWGDDPYSFPGLVARGASLGGRFRYIDHKTAPGVAIGVFRLRYRPHDADNAAGIDREALRVGEWAEWLDRIFRSD